MVRGHARTAGANSRRGATKKREISLNLFSINLHSWVGFEIELLCLVADSKRKILCSLSAIKPNSSISRPTRTNYFTETVSFVRIHTEKGIESQNQTIKVAIMPVAPNGRRQSQGWLRLLFMSCASSSSQFLWHCHTENRSTRPGTVHSLQTGRMKRS